MSVSTCSIDSIVTSIGDVKREARLVRAVAVEPASQGNQMVQAIGSSTASSARTSGVTSAGLEVQLVRYQKQLSECVNCDSSKTAKGKADIQAISARITEIKDRIDKFGGLSPGSQAPRASTTASPENTDASVAPAVRGSIRRGTIDVYA